MHTIKRRHYDLSLKTDGGLALSVTLTKKT